MPAPTPMCDQFPDQVAVSKFRWAHGLEGYCCSKSQFLIQQAAGNARQVVSFAPLAPVEPVLGRTERQKYIAAQLAAEGEADETKRRAGKLYDQNQELSKALEHVKTLLTERDTQNKELQAELEAVALDRDKFSRQAGNVAIAMDAMKDQVSSANEAGTQLLEARSELVRANEEIARLQVQLEA